MWTLLALGLIAAAAAVPRDPALQYNVQLQSARNSVMSHRLTSKFEDQLKKQCQRYGDEDSYDNIINVRNSVLRGLQGAAMEEVVPYLESGEKPDTVKILCKLSPTVKSSAKRLVAALKPCMKPSSQMELEYLTKVTDSVLDYVCYNDGQRVKNFINEGGVDCLNEKQSGLLQCAESAVSGEESDSDSTDDNTIFGSGESLNEEEREKKLANECREASTLQTCVKRELDQCSNPSSSTFITGLLDSAFTPICQKFITN